MKFCFANEIHIFIHVCTLGHWKEILWQEIAKVRKSGLYDACDSISLGVVGSEDVTVFASLFPKIHLLYQDPDVTLYERKTLLQLHDFCSAKADDTLVLYLHTKGVRHGPHACQIEDWRNYLLYFTVERWRDCVSALTQDDLDVCSVNWLLLPSPHFSGNFWWATAGYIKSLPHFIGSQYTDPEMWFCQNNPKYKCFYKSNIDHYCQRFPRSIYKN